MGCWLRVIPKDSKFWRGREDIMEARLIGTASASSFSCWKSHLESPLPLQNRLKGENISMAQLKPKMLGDDDIHLNSLSLNLEVRRNEKNKIFFCPNCQWETPSPYHTHDRIGCNSVTVPQTLTPSSMLCPLIHSHSSEGHKSKGKVIICSCAWAGMPSTNAFSPGRSWGWLHPELIQLSGHQWLVSKSKSKCSGRV